MSVALSEAILEPREERDAPQAKRSSSEAAVEGALLEPALPAVLNLPLQSHCGGAL